MGCSKSSLPKIRLWQVHPVAWLPHESQVGRRELGGGTTGLTIRKKHGLPADVRREYIKGEMGPGESRGRHSYAIRIAPTVRGMMGRQTGRGAPG